MRKMLRAICLVFLVILTLSGPVWASESEEEDEELSGRLVRIGYYQGDSRFQDGFSEEKRKSGYAYEYYQYLAGLTGWRYEYVYGSRSDVLEKLLAGQVDIVAGIYRTDKRGEQVLFSKRNMGLEGDARYFAVNPNRKDLLLELDEAMDKLSAAAPDFTITLRQKYYRQNMQWDMLTETETAWLAEKGFLSIGYVRDNLPLSDQGEDGEAAGVASDLIEWLSGYLKIPLHPVCYDSAALMEEALQNGEIDAAFPVYSDLWITERKGFLQTDSFISDQVMVVYQGVYHDDLMDKIALNRLGVGLASYLSVHFPAADIIYYESREAVFRALEKGEVNCLIGCSSILQRFLSEHTEFQNLNIAYLDASEDFSMAVNRGNYILAEILNKAVLQIDDAIITNAMIRHSNVQGPYTLKEFLQRNALIVIATLSLVFAALLGLFLNFRSKTRRYNQEQAKTLAALEDALEAAKAASVAKTTFLSSMSHDIRTPLNGIIGMTAIAEAHIDDPARVKDCLMKTASSGKHLLALINEVLDMSRIESGEMQLNEETLELGTLIDNLITLNQAQANARRHELIVHILDVTHERVIGDEVRLQQVFTNLLSNAIKYTPDGGRIEVTLSEKPSNNPKLGCFEFTVTDNGIGMSEDFLPHLFDVFSRAENAPANHTQGTGLGMPIARNIVRMMGGNITVESTLGVGSTFTATIFLKLKDTEEIPYGEYLDLSVLVVDDDPMICKSACLLMEEMGVKGEWVLSGQEAVERIEERHKNGQSYFAVLIDWKMPGMDGLETTREIRRRIGSDMPIAILSAYDWSAIESEALAAGASGFIGKPLFRSRLTHLFDQLLNREEESASSNLRTLTASTSFTGKRGLLAEDNELNAEIAMEIFSMTGLAVDWACNGQEAVDKMAASAPGYYDCIFMDIQMPVMNGIDAAKQIRAMDRPDTKTIPIFAMTANAFVEDEQMVLNAGMNEHIAKPLNLDRLMSILNQYLGSGE